jgi:hypothetical protein
MSVEITENCHGPDGKFVKGKRHPRAGKPKGAKSKISRSVKECVMAALDNDPGFFDRLREENPAVFAHVAARLIPAELRAEVEGKVGATIIQVVTGVPASPGHGVPRYSTARLPAGSVESTAVTEDTPERSTRTESSNREQDDSKDGWTRKSRWPSIPTRSSRPAMDRRVGA